MKTTRDYDFMISVGQMCRHTLNVVFRLREGVSRAALSSEAWIPLRSPLTIGSIWFLAAEFLSN